MSILLSCRGPRERQLLAAKRPLHLDLYKRRGLSRYFSTILFLGLLLLAVASGNSSAQAQTQTWISGINASTTASAASITWNTAVPSDSQVEYGATAYYGKMTSRGTRQSRGPRRNSKRSSSKNDISLPVTKSDVEHDPGATNQYYCPGRSIGFPYSEPAVKARCRRRLDVGFDTGLTSGATTPGPLGTSSLAGQMGTSNLAPEYRGWIA
jgi:hypothetical protein